MSQPLPYSPDELDAQRLEGLFSQDFVGVAIFRGPEYILERVNGLLCEIWGRRAEDILGRGLYDFMPELRGQGFEELLRRTLTTGEPYIGLETPVELRRKGQIDTVYFSFSYSPMRDDAGRITGIIVIASDATEQVMSRWAAEAAQAEAEEGRHELHRLFMQAPALIAVLRGPQHVFELANPPYVEVVAAGKDIIGQPVAEAFPEVVEQGFLKILDKVYRTGQPYEGREVEIRFRRDGHTETLFVNFIYQPTYDAAHHVDGIFVHAVDVTDQVRARRASEGLSRQLESIYEQMPDGLIIASADGIQRVNAKALEILGFDAAEDIKNVSNMFKQTKVRYAENGQTVPPQASALARALRGETLQYEVIIANRKTHQDRIFRVAAAPIADANGQIISAISVMTDINERKQLEQQKDDFIGIATHELKTPVTSLKTYAQLMQRRFAKAKDDTSAATMGKIIGQVDKLTSLIGDLLDVTKIDAGKLPVQPDDVDFDALMHATVETLQLTAPGHQLIIKGSTGATVHTDADRVEQVIINLVSNAVKYSPQADRVEVILSAKDGHIRVAVRDFGIGIPADKQPAVFERFFRVGGPKMASFPGLGLGLFISSEIVHRLGGRIWVDSDGRTGSTFCFELPFRAKL